MILQELCRLRLDWDDPIPPKLESLFSLWFQDLHELSDSKVDRCLRPEKYAPDPGERPERLMAFIEDDLLRKDMGITHHDEDIEDDEELSPTLENLLILIWLRLIHPELPKLLKQIYGTELRARTLTSIKPEISQALESLLEELRTTEDAKSMRAAVKRFSQTKQSSFVPRSNYKSCPLCKSAGRPDRHFRSASAATKLNAKITSSSQSAHQADGSSPLTVVGETRLTFIRDKHQLYFEGLEVENLDSDILAGIPFMEKNDIYIRPARRQVLIGNDCIYKYGSSANETSNYAVHRARVARAPSDATILWPGDYIDVKIPADMVSTDDVFFIEPHTNDSYGNILSWPEPSLVSSVAGNLRIPNPTDEPLILKRNEHFCKVRSTYTLENKDITSPEPAVAA
ncbi:unnamed protein product [Mytilus coruscus]|uniref:Uncharacterized protein n=1 Tax=Mytilus coruscus TaxID=42192 RepID=A0A6J8DXK6_MYTCO|nr:unnamed protein product [Mytilus coruscus]